MQSVYVPMTAAMKERLRQVALRERRDPRLQAAVLLEQALTERQSLPTELAEREPLVAA
jgi:hypothetical protein